MPPFREVSQQSSRPPKRDGEQWLYNLNIQPKPIEKPRTEIDPFWSNFTGKQKELGMRLHDEWLKRIENSKNRQPVELDTETSRIIQTAVEEMISANNNEMPRPKDLMIEGSPLHKHVQMYNREAKSTPLYDLSDELKAKSTAAVAIYYHLRQVIKKIRNNTAPRKQKIRNNTAPRPTKEIRNNTTSHSDLRKIVPRPITQEIGDNTTSHGDLMPQWQQQQQLHAPMVGNEASRLGQFGFNMPGTDPYGNMHLPTGDQPTRLARKWDTLDSFNNGIQNTEWNPNDTPHALQPRNEEDLQFGPMPFQMLTAEYQPPVPLSEDASTSMSDFWNGSMPGFAEPMPESSETEPTAFGHTASLSEDASMSDFWNGSMPRFAETMYGPSGTEQQAFDHPASLYNMPPNNTWSDEFGQ
jgi:hypothetical protein